MSIEKVNQLFELVRMLKRNIEKNLAQVAADVTNLESRIKKLEEKLNE